MSSLSEDVIYMCAGWILAQCVLSNLFCEWLPHDNVAHTEFDDSPRENRVLTFADEHGDMLCEYVFLSRALLVCVLAMCVSCVRTCPSACTRLCLGLFVVAVLTTLLHRYGFYGINAPNPNIAVKEGSTDPVANVQKKGGCCVIS